MAQELLLRKLFKTLHITLIFIVALFGSQATAQSVLLPGDVVIVSANADTNSFDFIPLIDIDRGTKLYFSNGTWNDSSQALTGSELEITFNEPIQAGTNIHINEIAVERISISGNIAFSGNAHRLFAYQKESELYRFIFGIGWGKDQIWNTSEEARTASDIPLTLKEANTLLTLGEFSNYQYYIRNGASGTRNLLLKFVGDAAHWRGNDAPFQAFGTSFNLLLPPVILFENSISTVSEGDSLAILNVAIYGHDGSRLSVDVLFDSLRSTVSSSDIERFKKASLNFTGLVGDAVYEVWVSINDDNEYEGLETGIFTLRNLTKGSYGDFLTHTLIIQDNDQPEVLITKVENMANVPSHIEIQNNEDAVVDMNGWTLTSRDKTYTFPKNVKLYPLEVLNWMDFLRGSQQENLPNTIWSDLDEALLNARGGNLILKNQEGEVIDKFTYLRIRSTDISDKVPDNMVAESKKSSMSVQQEVDPSSSETKQMTATQVKKPGWKVLVGDVFSSDELKEKEFYAWDEESGKFKMVSADLITQESDEIVFGYFKADETTHLEEVADSNFYKINMEENISVNISATDANENEIIDGLEGLNLAFNHFDTPVPVHKFIELSKTALQHDELTMHVYGVQKNSLGGLEYILLKNDAEIASKAPFWILVDTPLEPVEYSISKETLIQQNEVVVDTEPIQEQNTLVEIALGSDSLLKKLTLNFVEELKQAPVKDLDSYPGLFLPNHSFLNVAFKQGDDYYNNLILSANMEQGFSLPVFFSTNEAGQLTFTVTEWNEIPAGWEIKLEDKAVGKTYNLRSDFSYTFEHSAAEHRNENQSEDARGFEDFVADDRFILHISPVAETNEIEEEVTDEPRELELHQNFPNPFNPITTISFHLPEPHEVKLSVFNIVGQPVAVIAEGSMSAGEHHFEWDATDKPSGMYIYQLEIGKRVMTRKMTLVK